jgi:hypothetical protein
VALRSRAAAERRWSRRRAFRIPRVARRGEACMRLQRQVGVCMSEFMGATRPPPLEERGAGRSSPAQCPPLRYGWRPRTNPESQTPLDPRRDRGKGTARDGTGRQGGRRLQWKRQLPGRGGMRRASCSLEEVGSVSHTETTGAKGPLDAQGYFFTVYLISDTPFTYMSCCTKA